MRPSLMVMAAIGEASPELAADPEFAAALDPRADLEARHARLVEQTDGTRRWLERAGAEERDQRIRDLERQLVEAGLEVDRAVFERFMAGDDEARPLSWAPTGVEEVVGPAWSDRYWLESRAWQRRGLFTRSQVEFVLLAVQGQVPALLLEAEHEDIAGLEGQGPLLFRSELPLRRGAVITLVLVFPAQSLTEAEQVCQRAFADWPGPLERSLPVDDQGQPMGDLQGLVSPGRFEHFVRQAARVR